MNIVTFSDSNYMCKCLTLHSSISKFVKEFNFYYLCLDDKTYETAKLIKNCIPIHINELTDSELSIISTFDKNTNSFSDYHFALSPYVCNLFLLKYNLEDIIYCDSDIYFTDNIESIKNSCQQYDIGLCTHKHIPKTISRKTGFYNVGVLYFKNSNEVKEILKFWLNCTIDKENKYFKSHGTCGDQKYLELFEILYPNVKIKTLDDDIGHLAPWNCEVVKKIENYDITWNGEHVYGKKGLISQKLTFFHFSHFVENYDKNKYSFNRGGDWDVDCLKIKFKHLYDEYFKELKNNKLIYNI